MLKNLKKIKKRALSILKKFGREVIMSKKDNFIFSVMGFFSEKNERWFLVYRYMRGFVIVVWFFWFKSIVFFILIILLVILVDIWVYSDVR